MLFLFNILRTSPTIAPRKMTAIDSGNTFNLNRMRKWTRKMQSSRIVSTKKITSEFRCSSSWLKQMKGYRIDQKLFAMNHAMNSFNSTFNNDKFDHFSLKSPTEESRGF